MISKKLVGIVTSAFLLFNMAVTAGVRTANTSNKAGVSSELAQLPHDNYFVGGPYDLSIANEEKIISMLKKEGKIAKNATSEQIQKAYRDYMNKLAKSQTAGTSQITEMDKKLRSLNASKLTSYTNQKSTSSSLKKTSATGLKEVQEQKWDGTVEKDRVMVLLIDFPDFKHNNIKPEDDPTLYYEDYTHQHYEDMIFGDNGYVGPNGEKFISVKQFYEQQSGGSYTIEGKVLGWYTAKYNASYYGGHDGDNNDAKPRNLIAEALQNAAKDPVVQALPGGLGYFDVDDRYDMDEDGNISEPDKMIDHLIVIHAGTGEEAGGGALGDDAIWSHRWNLGGLYKIPGTDFVAYDYTTEPEDGAAGVFAHEYGHDLGLPDEYDTNYSGAGEPIGNWSIMSSGSWTGKIAGTEPSGFSPYAKEFFQATLKGNWQPNVETINYSDITTTGRSVILDQANSHGLNKNVVRVNLPDHKLLYNTPFDKYAYYGGKGKDGKDGLDTNMAATADLSAATTAALKFKTWYDIEKGWDFATIEVKEQGQADTEWKAIKGNITTTEHNSQADIIVANGITGSSDEKWVDAQFDLTAYAGKKIDLRFRYQCDLYSYGKGFFVDNVALEANGTAILTDNAEGTPSFTLTGFVKSDGMSPDAYKNYYLVEWRNQQGVDSGLANINRGGKMLSYDPGMVVWYVDEAYTDNWTGTHPGDGYLGIADADQTPLMWAPTDGRAAFAASNGYQMHDAAFSLRKSSSFFLDQTTAAKRTLTDNNTFMRPFFDDARSFMNPATPNTGRNIPKLGIKIYVTGETKDRTSASILIKK